MTMELSDMEHTNTLALLFKREAPPELTLLNPNDPSGSGSEIFNYKSKIDA